MQLVLFPTGSGENSSFFSRLLPGARPAARPEVGRRTAGGSGARTPGAAATWPPEPGPWRWSFVGRAAPGAEPGLPHTRTAAAAPEARVAPGGGWEGCSSEFKGYGRRHGRLRQRLLPLLHTPGLRASSLGDRETALRGAGGGAGAAGEETRGCRSPARNHSLPLPFCLPLLPSPLALAP